MAAVPHVAQIPTNDVAVAHAAPMPPHDAVAPPHTLCGAAAAGGSEARSFARRLLTPGEADTTALVGLSFSTMLALFAIDAATGDAARLQALYVFPLALVAIHAQRGAVSAAFALSLALQSITVLAFDGPAVSLATDLVIAAASSTLTVLLARGLRTNYLAAARLASTDPLTGLHNRRAFELIVAAEIARHRRYGGVFTLAMLDLDDFKRLNDSRGHQAGDRALEHVAGALQAHSRASDAVARLGGDEFAVLLTNTGAMDGARFCLDLAARVASRLAGAGLPVTASVGWQAFDFAPESVDAALHAADLALYEAKRARKAGVTPS